VGEGVGVGVGVGGVGQQVEGLRPNGRPV